MASIYRFKCNNCDLDFGEQMSGSMYTKDENGNKVICPSPLETSYISRTLKIDRNIVQSWMRQKFADVSLEDKEKLDDKVGFDSNCLCLDCLNQFGLDIKKEKRECPKCNSINVKTFFELKDQTCPKCKTGKFTINSTGAIT